MLSERAECRRFGIGRWSHGCFRDLFYIFLLSYHVEVGVNAMSPATFVVKERGQLRDVPERLPPPSLHNVALSS